MGQCVRGAVSWLKRPGWAWVLVALLLVAPAAVLAPQADPEHATWALQPAQGWGQLRPWALWSAAWAHASAQHAQYNLLAGLLVGALGWALRAPWQAAAAWVLAWPVTHALLMLDPRLAWYAGASGVLHAGVAVLAVALWPRHRGLSATLVVLILTKVLLDVASGVPVAYRAGLDVPMASLSHLFGVLTGFAFAGFHHGRNSHNDRN